MSVYQYNDHSGRGSSPELWARALVHDFLPQVGQRIAMLYTEEEPGGSCHEEVVDVYFDFDGTANITMMATILDPDEHGQQALHRSFREHRSFSETNPRNRRTAWYTDQDGDLEARLRECGWLPYAEWPQEWKR